MIKSARAVSERFFSNRGIEDGEILYVFPVFDTEVGEKDPLTVADDFVRGSL